jgi:VanZ family protein
MRVRFGLEGQAGCSGRGFFSGRVRRILHSAYVGLVLFVSLWPRACVDAYVAEGIQRQELWIHAICFAGLAVLTLWTYGVRRVPWRSRLATWVVCTLFGALLEVLQFTLPGVNRQCTLYDMVDNAAGAAVGALLVPVGLWPRRRNEGDLEDEQPG